jgi:hypothetical protein
MKWFFFFQVGLGFELRVLYLHSTLSTTSATTPDRFCSGYFGDEGLEVFAQARPNFHPPDPSLSSC